MKAVLAQNRLGKLVFQQKGKITGLKQFTYFEVVYDFTEGVNFDAILCYENVEKQERPQVYKFKFINSELLLYEVTTDWETLERTVSHKAIRLTQH